jgi:hypothetical protein
VLQTEQKKNDFKSDEITNQVTPACAKIIKEFEAQINKINACLDGKNVNSVLQELGIKFHRTIYDHIFRYEYNETGGMTLIRDISEYRLFAKNFHSLMVDKLFIVLYSLSNLLIVEPQNLPEITSGENLVSFF